MSALFGKSVEKCYESGTKKNVVACSVKMLFQILLSGVKVDNCGFASTECITVLLKRSYLGNKSSITIYYYELPL